MRAQYDKNAQGIVTERYRQDQENIARWNHLLWSLNVYRRKKEAAQAALTDPAVVTTDPSSDTSTTPGTPTETEREAKGTTGTRKGRQGRKREPLTPLESEVWRLYQKHKGSHDPHYQIVEILEANHPHLEMKTVKQIVRKVKARERRDAEASRKPGTKSPVKRK